MRVCKPNVDFPQARARRAPAGEFAQQMNASPLRIPYLQRLSKMMKKLASPRILKAWPPFHNPRRDPESKAYLPYMANIETALV